MHSPSEQRRMSFCSCFWENSHRAQLLAHMWAPRRSLSTRLLHWRDDGTPDMSRPAQPHPAVLRCGGVPGSHSHLLPAHRRLRSALLGCPITLRSFGPPRLAKESNRARRPAFLQRRQSNTSVGNSYPYIKSDMLTVNFQSLWSFFVGYVTIITVKC